jgi:chorismate mutase-like protein
MSITGGQRITDGQRETGGLEPFRRRLDQLDEQIVEALGERFAICREIALYKRDHEIAMMQPGRVAEVRARYLARGADAGLPRQFTGEFFELLIAATCRMEDELIEGESAGVSVGGAQDAR